MEASALYAPQPSVFETQNWISGIALNVAANVVAAVGTCSLDLPVVFPHQAANAGFADARGDQLRSRE